MTKPATLITTTTTLMGFDTIEIKLVVILFCVSIIPVENSFHARLVPAPSTNIQ